MGYLFQESFKKVKLYMFSCTNQRLVSKAGWPGQRLIYIIRQVPLYVNVGPFFIIDADGVNKISSGRPVYLSTPPLPLPL
jgi:hypothetical protein